MTKKEFEFKIKAIKAKVDAADSLEVLAEDEIFILLAFELWGDGMDWGQGILEIAQGKNPLYNTREKAMHILKTVFIY